MNLGEAGVREERAFFVSAIGGGDIAAARVGRKIENISVAAGREHDGIARVRFDFSRHQTAGDDPFGVAVDQDEIEHLGLRKHLDRAGRDLPAKRLIRAEEKLLAGLAARVKRARNLRAAERTIREQPAVFARERHTLLDALVDDQIADFRQPIDVRFARAEIAAFDRVVKQPEDAVAIVLIIFRGVDAALGGDAVGAARAVLVTEAFHVVAELAQRGGGRSAGQSAADDDDFKFPAVIRSDQARVVLVAGPFLVQRTGWNLRVQISNHSASGRLHEMKKNRDRDGGVTNENQPGKNPAGGGETRRELFVIQAERLEKTRGSVAQMQGEQKHSEDIKAGDENILKAVDHHGIDVVAVERIRLEQQESGIGDADGEMREVIENEGENDQSAQRHGARGEGCLHVLLLFVARRAGPPILEREADRVENVQEHVHEEKDPDDPEQGTELAQMFRVAVHPIGPEKNLQVPEKMSDDEHDQDHTGHRHDHFLADR